MLVLASSSVSTSCSSRPVDWIHNPVDQFTVNELVSMSWHLLALLTSWQSRPVGLSRSWWSTNHPRTVFVYSRPFQPSLMYLGLALEPTLGWSTCKLIHSDVRLGWKGLPGDKQSYLFRTFLNYGQKKIYNIEQVLPTGCGLPLEHLRHKH